MIFIKYSKKNFIYNLFTPFPILKTSFIYSDIMQMKILVNFVLIKRQKILS
jgi:hypothetical protein